MPCHIMFLHSITVLIFYRVHIMNPFVMQFSPVSCYFLPLRSNYSPQQPVLSGCNVYILGNTCTTSSYFQQIDPSNHIDSSELEWQLLLQNMATCILRPISLFLLLHFCDISNYVKYQEWFYTLFPYEIFQRYKKLCCMIDI